MLVRKYKKVATQIDKVLNSLISLLYESNQLDIKLGIGVSINWNDSLK